MAVDFGAVGARIRACRLEAGMSQERLAELSDLSTPYVSHIERMAKKPSLSALILFLHLKRNVPKYDILRIALLSSFKNLRDSFYGYRHSLLSSLFLYS